MDPIVARINRPDSYPPGWDEWSAAVTHRSQPAALGLGCHQAHLNRFAARYRLATEFEGVQIRRYGADTVAGYSGLFKLFLAWSAFEQYLKAIPCTQKNCMSWFSRHVPVDAVEKVRAFDAGNNFYNLIRSKSNEDVAHQLQRYLNREDFNFTYLASSIRHIFAHGILTPNAKNADPMAVAQMCELLSDIHLQAAGRDFENRVIDFLSRP